MSVRTQEQNAQQVAANPALSAFVTANAGSGKTKTLIDRVARLLLAGTPPEAILCVTYTKAAASEMQRRLFAVLGEWSILADAELRSTLSKLEDRPFPAERLSDARRLFALALGTPGGLKIQTIHAFCEKLLRRFPLEAGISPRFRVMDDPAATALSIRARASVARYALEHPGEIADAYARLSVRLDFGAFEEMFKQFETRRGELSAFFGRVDGIAGAVGWVWRAVDVPAGSTPASLGAEAMARLDRSVYQLAADHLRRGAKSDTDRAATLLSLMSGDPPDIGAALNLFFTARGEGEGAKWLLSSAVLKAAPEVQYLLLSEQARLEGERQRMRAAAVARDSLDVLALAEAYLTTYALEKASAGALDFADLIEKARHLLRDQPAAAWVLYKLDGGIDHILLDEAQDTAPDQWKIIDALVDEFFSGAGASGGNRQRQMFVVGDEKQSIYSFQGAQPEQLIQKFQLHAGRAVEAGFDFRRLELRTSYRSTPQVLSFVDKVFARPPLAAAIQSREGAEEVRHVANRSQPGCVEVWDLMLEQPGARREAWDAPVDLEPETSANRRLAGRIAREIKAMIARGEAVTDKETGEPRAAHAGDVLILVRRRGVLFEEILRALKQEGVPVAGADRLALSEHIVFHDLLAMARFACFPEDELTLAALLKSPFCGLDDDALYALAHGRGRENLWPRLRHRADGHPAWTEALVTLGALTDLARTCRPFEFYARFLGRVRPDGRSMRQALLRRLGSEAQDALDEFLSQVLAAEQRGVHDLERLAAEMARLQIIVGREMDAARGEVRVMTTHGAKGLEAPIVFLPETTVELTGRGSGLLSIMGTGGDDGFLWCTSKARDCTATADAREARTMRETDEAYRLLYVALTRARDRLVICGRAKADFKADTVAGWWGAIRDALAALADEVQEVETPEGRLRRYGPTPDTRPPAPVDATAVPAPLPPWAHAVAPAEAFARYASPSDLGEGAAVAAPSPLAAAEGLGRFRRGDLIHRLLQLLPDIPAAERAAGAAALLARELDLTDDHRAEMATAALSVLEDARFLEVFGDGSRGEVAIAGTAPTLPPGLRISGRIDRLVVLPQRVLVIDFKTNRPSPARIEEADPAYLRQMALYAAVLAEIFPGRQIEPAIVWTDGPKLMPVPENLWVQTLADLRRAG